MLFIQIFLYIYKELILIICTVNYITVFTTSKTLLIANIVFGYSIIYYLKRKILIVYYAYFYYEKVPTRIFEIIQERGDRF